MGYSERWCQLCGISFNVGRVRTADEPVEAAWKEFGHSAVENEHSCCEADDCSSVTRTVPAHVYHDGSVGAPEEICEHIAGLGCTSTQGYSGHRISVDEMKECMSMQCLMSKTEYWTPEPGDEDFEIAAELAWLTGTSKGPPDEFDIHGLLPTRHGVSDTLINNINDDDPNDWAMPMHPYCFEIFKQESLRHFGKVHIDGLRRIWLANEEYDQRFLGFPVPPDVDLVDQQWYNCVPGTEYLVSHPLRIPGLQELINSCVDSNKPATDVFSALKANEYRGRDPFAMLPPELKLMLLLQLRRQDVASLRLATRSFQQLPQIYFHHLVTSEMPWMVRDIETLPPKEVDWHRLWSKLSVADGGSQEDEIERVWSHRTQYLKTLWKALYEVMTSEERERVGFDPTESRPREITDEQYEIMQAIMKERGETRQLWPKETELKGLRNRRRIYGDVQRFLQKIEELEREVAT